MKAKMRAQTADMERAVIGAIGGSIVAVIAYPLPAYESFLVSDGGVYYLLGWSIRSISLAFLGGLWAYLHTNEKDRMKTFQLGIVGPAIISAMVSANANKVDEQIDSARLFVIFPSAYAQSSSETTSTSSPREKILDGLLGTQRP